MLNKNIAFIAVVNDAVHNTNRTIEQALNYAKLYKAHHPECRVQVREWSYTDRYHEYNARDRWIDVELPMCGSHNTPSGIYGAMVEYAYARSVGGAS